MKNLDRAEARMAFETWEAWQTVGLGWVPMNNSVSTSWSRSNSSCFPKCFHFFALPVLLVIVGREHSLSHLHTRLPSPPHAEGFSTNKMTTVISRNVLMKYSGQNTLPFCPEFFFSKQKIVSIFPIYLFNPNQSMLCVRHSYFFVFSTCSLYYFLYLF